MFVVVQLILLWLVVFFLVFWVFSLQEKLKGQDSLLGEVIVTIDKLVDKYVDVFSSYGSGK